MKQCNDNYIALYCYLLTMCKIQLMAVTLFEAVSQRFDFSFYVNEYIYIYIYIIISVFFFYNQLKYHIKEIHPHKHLKITAYFSFYFSDIIRKQGEHLSI